MNGIDAVLTHQRTEMLAVGFPNLCTQHANMEIARAPLCAQIEYDKTEKQQRLDITLMEKK